MESWDDRHMTGLPDRIAHRTPAMCALSSARADPCAADMCALNRRFGTLRVVLARLTRWLIERIACDLARRWLSSESTRLTAMISNLVRVPSTITLTVGTTTFDSLISTIRSSRNVSPIQLYNP